MTPTFRSLFPALAGLFGAACVAAGAGPGSEVTHHGFSVDPVNAQACMECHDGGLGPNIPLPRNLCKTSGSHPAFIAYPPSGRIRDFHPPGQVIAAGIRLLDGKVTCLSCHDVEKETLHHLAIEDTGSQLCLACHKM